MDHFSEQSFQFSEMSPSLKMPMPLDGPSSGARFSGLDEEKIEPLLT
jgi:hypothetical protein